MTNKPCTKLTLAALKFVCLNASEWLLAAFQLISTIVFLRLCAIVFRLNDNVHSNTKGNLPPEYE